VGDATPGSHRRSADTVVVAGRNRPTGDQIVTPHGEYFTVDDQAHATFANEHGRRRRPGDRKARTRDVTNARAGPLVVLCHDS
jgi:hypothetical protein